MAKSADEVAGGLAERTQLVRTVILGGSGFLGAWVARALIAQGHEVVGLLRPSSQPWRIEGMPGLSTVFALENDWPTEIGRIAPETLVSLDWAGVDSSKRDDEAQWANLDRQRAAFAAAAKAGTRRYVGIGSQAEYGPRTDRIVESVDPRPRTVYGRAKLAALSQLREAAERTGLEWVWARVFSVYGPMDNPGFLLHAIAEALQAGKDVELSSGEQLWSYLYASDAATAVAVLSTHANAGGVYNLGHPSAPRLRDLIEEFASHFSSGGRLLFAAEPSAKSAISRLEPDMDRLLSLGWRPRTSSADGLRTTAEWLRSRRVPDPFQSGREIPRAPMN